MTPATAAEGADEATTSGRSPEAVLRVLVASLVLVRSLDQVLYYRVNIQLQTYTWWLSSVLYPCFFLLAVTPVVAFQHHRGHVTRETLAFPKRKLLCMALLDQVANTLTTWPQAPLGGTACNVLSQGVLPLNMALSAYFLRTRYERTHFLGAALALGAGVIQVLPGLLQGGGGSGTATTGAEVGLWLGVYFLGLLPTAGSNVYKEGLLKATTGLDVWYVNALVAAFQLALGLLSFPLVALPFTAGAVPIRRLPSYLAAAAACTIGRVPHAGPDDACAADVAPAAAIMALFIGFNVAFCALMLVVFRRGSSTLYSIASVARIPVVAVMLLVPALAGPRSAVWHWNDGVAAALAVLGLLIYQARPELRAPVGGGDLAVPLLAQE